MCFYPNRCVATDIFTPLTHPGSVGLALVAKSKNQDNGHNSEDDCEQDADIIVWLKREDGKITNVCNHLLLDR